MPPFQNYRIARFGSLNEDRNPGELKPGELTLALNCGQTGNFFGTRPGLALEASGNDYDAPVEGAAPISAIYEFQDRSDGGNLLVATNDNIYYGEAVGEILDKTTNSITINTAKDVRWTFAEHKGNMYGCGGEAGDFIFKWDGNTGNALTRVTFQNSSAADIDAQFIHQQYNYGFIAGMNGTAAEDNPMVVRYSALNDLDTWPAGNTIGGDSAIGGLDSFGNNEITGLAEHQDNNGHWMMILTKRRLYPVVENPSHLAPFLVQPPVQNGCVSHEAFVPLGLDSGDAIYMSDNGIHSLRQSQQHGSRADRFLSWPIRNTFQSLNRSRLKFSTGVYDPVEGRVLFSVAEGSDTDQKVILAMEIKDVDDINVDTVRWRIWRPVSINANYLALARDPSDTPTVYLGDTVGNAYRFQTTTFTDAGSAYNVEWRTNHESLGSPGSTKSIGDVYIDAAPGGAYAAQLRYYFDYGRRIIGPDNIQLSPTETNNWGPTGGMIWGQSLWSNESDLIEQKKLYGRGAGHNFGFGFFHNGSNEPFYVTDFEAQVRLFGESPGTRSE